MSEEKRCVVCGINESKNWIEKKNPIGQTAYFCSKEHHEKYKKQGEETGVCEFC
ncbi:hypothetical protein HY988_00585 [Candidatus Micrarchaeota archaeon]|nr:hypothetical protein [Candidatus Micrarchaeota archaeon]